MISYHASGDPFYNACYTPRASLYHIPGTPTVVFDGVEGVAGGMDFGSMYEYYAPIFSARTVVPPPVDIGLRNVSLNAFEAWITNISATAVSATVQFAVVEKDIPCYQGFFEHVFFVCRALLPSSSGQDLSLNPGQNQLFTQDFTIQAGWDWKQCQLVAFVQDKSSGEVHQAAVLPLPNVQVTSPVPDEAWQAGSDHTVTWVTAPDVQAVTLDYSTDGGGTWQPVAASIENTGSYPWTVPGQAAPDGRFRIHDDAADPAQGWVQPFSIVSTTDLDGDGQTTAADRILLADYLAENRSAVPPADFNGDGFVDLLDLWFLSSLLPH